MINYNDYSKNNSKVRTGLVKDSLAIKTRRSGIVLYTKYADTIYFCFGRDSKTHELSDFGGRTESSETAVDAAVREFQEETLGVFKLTKEDILESFCMYDRDSMVIMVRVDESPNKISDVFNKKAKDINKEIVKEEALKKSKERLKKIQEAANLLSSYTLPNYLHNTQNIKDQNTRIIGTPENTESVKDTKDIEQNNMNEESNLDECIDQNKDILVLESKELKSDTEVKTKEVKYESKYENKLEICGMVWVDFYDMMVCIHTSNSSKRTGVFFHRLELLFRKVKNIHLEL